MQSRWLDIYRAWRMQGQNVSGEALLHLVGAHLLALLSSVLRHRASTKSSQLYSSQQEFHRLSLCSRLQSRAWRKGQSRGWGVLVHAALIDGVIPNSFKHEALSPSSRTRLDELLCRAARFCQNITLRRFWKMLWFPLDLGYGKHVASLLCARLKMH